MQTGLGVRQRVSGHAPGSARLVPTCRNCTGACDRSPQLKKEKNVSACLEEAHGAAHCGVVGGVGVGLHLKQLHSVGSGKDDRGSVRTRAAAG